MPWSDYYENDRNDRAPYFEVNCPHCGATRRNDEDFCPCGHGGGSYQSADASRWNRYVDRGR